MDTEKTKRTGASFLFLALFLFSFFVTQNTLAADFQSQSAAITIETIPQNPAPFSRVSLSLESYGIDLDRSLIVWVVNGKTELSGTGKKKFSLTLGGLGSVTAVRVEARSSVSGTATQTITFTPGEVDLLWEAIGSYTPPFYKGKALPASQSSIRVTAIPHIISGGTEANPTNLVYQWKRDDKYREFYSQSGFGKQSVIFQKNIVSPNDLVGVEVSGLSGKIGAVARLSIGQYSPGPTLYRDHPLYGIQYERALTGIFAMEDQEVALLIEPFYFSSFSRENLSYAWRIGNKQLSKEEDEKSMVIFRNEGGEGNSAVSVEVRNPGRILQFATEKMSLVFGADVTNKTLFGL